MPQATARTDAGGHPSLLVSGGASTEDLVIKRGSSTDGIAI